MFFTYSKTSKSDASMTSPSKFILISLITELSDAPQKRI